MKRTPKYKPSQLATVVYSIEDKTPAVPFRQFDLARIDWEVACRLPGFAGVVWRNALQSLFVPARMFHPEEDLHRSVGALFNRIFKAKGWKYSPNRHVAATEMLYHAMLYKAGSDCWGNSPEEVDRTHDQMRRWMKFPYKDVILRGNRDRARYGESGLLPGEPDPPTHEGDFIVAKKKVSKKKATTKKKVSTAPGGSKKKTTSKKKVSKKTTKAAATPKAERPQPYGEYTAFTREGESYDKRLGRPGTARYIFCRLMMKKGGATRGQLTAAAIKAGLYKASEEERAFNQLKMNLISFKRDAESKGFTLTKIKDEKWGLEVDTSMYED